MKKLILGALALLTLAGCGVSTPAVTTTSSTTTKASTPAKTTKASEAYLVFTADSQESILVTVDGKQYQKETVQLKSTGSMKELQEMAGNIITLSPGTHQVRVTKGGKQVYQQSVSINAQERKVIRLLAAGFFVREGCVLPLKGRKGGSHRSFDVSTPPHTALAGP